MLLVETEINGLIQSLKNIRDKYSQMAEAIEKDYTLNKNHEKKETEYKALFGVILIDYARLQPLLENIIKEITITQELKVNSTILGIYLDELKEIVYAKDNTPKNYYWENQPPKVFNLLIELLEGEKYLLKNEKITLKFSKFKPPRIPSRHTIKNIYSIGNLQFRAMVGSQFINTLYFGLVSSYQISYEELIKDKSLFSIARDWLKRGSLVLQEEMASEQSKYSHRTNVNFFSGCLYVFKDYIEKGYTDRIYGGNIQYGYTRDMLFSYYIVQAMRVFYNAHSIDLEVLKDMYRNIFASEPDSVTKSHGANNLEYAINLRLLEDSGSLPVKPVINDKLIREKYRYLLKNIDDAIRLTNYTLATQQWISSHIELALSTDNVLLSFHNDFPYQATIVGAGVKQKDILGIIIDQELWNMHEDRNTEFRNFRKLYKDSPLTLALESFFFYQFMVYLKKCQCPNPIIRTLYHAREGSINITDVYNEKVLEQLSIAAKNYLSIFEVYFNATDNILAMIKLVSSLGYSVWDRKTGNLMNADYI